LLCDDEFEVNYCGLDSDRDTEKEVDETALRLFPDVLTSKGGAYHFLSYPTFGIQLYLCRESSTPCKVKAVSFIPLVVRLAIEFELFEEQYRGGLLCQDNVG
jgi:hypothetical protein